MPRPLHTSPSNVRALRRVWRYGRLLLIAGGMSACSIFRNAPEASTANTINATSNTDPVNLPAQQPAPPRPMDALQQPRISQARSAREYRRDAAAHLYALAPQRIYQGKLPPLLYAIGVVQVDINARGQVAAIRWMRAPTQAPEVIAEIERTVRMAAPFPAPVKMGGVTYTDTWLWHKSGQYQLDTLTEGQL